jgi:hypothetical protein
MVGHRMAAVDSGFMGLVNDGDKVAGVGVFEHTGKFLHSTQPSQAGVHVSPETIRFYEMLSVEVERPEKSEGTRIEHRCARIFGGITCRGELVRSCGARRSRWFVAVVRTFTSGLSRALRSGGTASSSEVAKLLVLSHNHPRSVESKS